jgi:ZIP family zinc transporter
MLCSAWMLRLILASTLTGSATALGALPFLVARSISRRAYDTLLGFGAGLMLAAATLGLLPAALRTVGTGEHVSISSLITVVVSFGAGALLLFLMDQLIPHVHAGGHHEHQKGHAEPDGHEHCHHDSVDDKARHQGVLVLGAMTLHRLPEGFAIGAGFANGATRPLGVLLAVSLAIQNVIEGAVMAAPLRRGGLQAAKLLGLVALTGLAVPIAAIIGFELAATVTGALPIALALAAGALIYLACNEIIPESHSHANERRATWGLLTGFVLVILLQVLGGHAD